MEAASPHLRPMRVPNEAYGIAAIVRVTGAMPRLAAVAGDESGDDPFCEIRTHCANQSTHRVATEVDHLITIRERPDLRLVWSNLRSACKSCHSARTMRDSVRVDR